MSDLLNNFTDNEVEKYIDAENMIRNGINPQVTKDKKSVFNPETGTHDILTPMTSGGYVKIGEESLDLEATRPGSILLNGMEYGRETPEYQRYYPDPEPQPNVMTVSPSIGQVEEAETAPLVSEQSRIESAKDYAEFLNTRGGATAQDLLAAGYDANTIKAIGIGADVEPMVLSTQEIEDRLRNGGSFLEYDPTIRETGRVELTQYLIKLAEGSLAEDLRAQGIKALNPEADTDATLTEDQIATLIEGERPRLENEARSLSGMFFGDETTFGIGVGDFVTAGVMDIQEGARLFKQGLNNDSVADRSFGALLVLAGIADATGVGMLVGKAIKKIIPTLRAGLANVGERLNQPGEMPTVGSNLGNVDALRREANIQRFGYDPNDPVAKVEAPTENKPGIIAFHGSGADFNEFKLEKIGTGEGNQAFGYGLYFSDVEDIAQYYRALLDFNNNMKGNRIKYKGKIFEDLGDTAAAEAAPPSYMAIKNIAEEMNKYLPANPKLATAAAAKERLLKRIEVDIENYSKAGDADSNIGTIEVSDGQSLEQLMIKEAEIRKQALLDINPDDIEIERGKVFKVKLDVTPDKLLDYDKPLGEQNDFIKKRLQKLVEAELNEDDAANLGFEGLEINKAKANMLDENRSVVSFLNDWAAFRGYDSAAEELLDKYGIKGIKYLENSSRNTSGGNLIDVSKTDDGFRAKVAVENRQGGVGGSGRIVTTSPPYKTEEQARDWADQAINKADNNYVIFDDKLIDIIKKYGIVPPVAVTAMGAKKDEKET